MRIISSDLDAEVAGTSVGDYLEVTAFRGSAKPVPLNVISWSVSWDATRQVQGQLAVTVDDPDGTLAPWSLGDILAPGGSRLVVAWVSGTSGMRVPWGRWLIRSATPDEHWLIFGGNRRVSSGGQVVIEADEDPMSIAALCRMDAEVPVTKTCIGEVKRLFAAVGVATIVSLKVSDAPIPSDLVYEESRSDAIEDHLARVNAKHRMAIDGSIEVIPPTMDPVWTIDGGEGGARVHITRGLSDEGLYNGVTSKNEVDAGDTKKQIVGRARLSIGPLEWDGPYGNRPMFHQSIATTQYGIDQDALTMLQNRRDEGEITIGVSCLFHPGLQMHDVVTVMAPTKVGDIALTGRVIGMSAQSVSGGGALPSKAMSLNVVVPVDVLEIIARRTA